MHIAIEASTWINPRGYGRFTRELTRALLRADSGHRFTLVVDSGAAAAGDLPDVPLLTVPTREAVDTAASASRSRSGADLWRMAGALSGRQFDAVLFPTVYSFVPVLSRAHVTVVIHDAMPETVPHLVLGSARSRLFWTVKSWLACRRADVVATVSQASAREIRLHLPVRRNRALTVLTEGVSAEFTVQSGVADADAMSPWVRTEPYVLYVGGMSPHKRVPLLIGAFGRLAARPEHRNTKLVIAGPGHLDSFRADDGGIADALASLGVHRSRVVHTGFVPDAVLAALYRQASCVVLPSIVEGFGLPALEAMACGAPLLAARTPALEELCGDAADYFDAAEDLPARLAALLADEPRRLVLRREGPIRARRFGWDEAARRWLQVLC